MAGGAYERRKTSEPGVYTVFRDGQEISTQVYYRVGTKQRVKTFAGAHQLTAAKRWKASNVTSKDTGERVDPAAGRVTLAELYDELHAAVPYAAKTVKTHGDIWRKTELDGLRRRAVNKITSGDVERVLNQIGAPGMRTEARKLLSRLFAFAMNEREPRVQLPSNPAKQASRKKTRSERIDAGSNARKEHRRLSPAELVRLIAEIPERYKALVHVMARVGLRPGEAHALTVGQLDPLRRMVLIDRAVSDGEVGPTKTGEHRTIVLPAAISDELVAHLERFSDPRAPKALMFPSETGRMIDAHNWRARVFQPASARAGVNHGLGPNDLRHTAVAWAISLGADVYSVQRMVGHAKPSITLDTYGYMWDGSQQQLAERMDAAIRAEGEATEAQVVNLR